MATKQTSTKAAARKRSTTKAPAKATAKKQPAKKATAPKAAGRGRAPVTPDAEITRWIKAELRQAERAGAPVPSAAGLLRTWRAQGGKANPQRFSALVAAAR